jgi:hypothetical protein
MSSPRKDAARLGIALVICALPSISSAQRGDTWSHAFSMADSGTVPAKVHEGACYGPKRQPDSLYLTLAQVADVEAWGGSARGWRALAGTWFSDTIKAALVAADCLADGRPRYITVERAGRFLRINALTPPGDPPDVIRVRDRHGVLVTLGAAELPNGGMALLSGDSLSAERATAARKREASDRRAAGAERAARRKALRAKGWASDIVEDVLRGDVRIGMTEAMVREAWGEPDHVNSTITASGRSEQWVYGESQYIYLETGRVTAIQSSR